VDSDRFEQIVLETIKSFPEDIQKKIDNLEIIVQNWSSRSHIPGFHPRKPVAVLGLYHGVPLRRRGSWYGNVLPDRILIFKDVIESRCRDDEEMVALTRRVVLHEFGHYFGIDDRTLRKLGY
jgi:predicted Zn-dependent protease with MMP-like domain